MKEWFVYVVKCSDNTLYCGSTDNIEKRIKSHNSGKGAKYTRGRGPVHLVGSKGGMTKSQALSLEYKVKKQTHSTTIYTNTTSPKIKNRLVRKARTRFTYKRYINRGD